jgi:hypothetical protein
MHTLKVFAQTMDTQIKFLLLLLQGWVVTLLRLMYHFNTLFLSSFCACTTHTPKIIVYFWNILLLFYVSILFISSSWYAVCSQISKRPQK